METSHSLFLHLFSNYPPFIFGWCSNFSRLCQIQIMRCLLQKKNKSDQTDTQTDSQTCGQTDTHTHRQTDRQTDGDSRGRAGEAIITRHLRLCSGASAGAITALGARLGSGRGGGRRLPAGRVGFRLPSPARPRRRLPFIPARQQIEEAVSVGAKSRPITAETRPCGLLENMGGGWSLRAASKQRAHRRWSRTSAAAVRRVQTASRFRQPVSRMGYCEELC